MTPEAASAPAPVTTENHSSTVRWGKRIGGIAFLFFVIKGLAWLLVPAALAAWAAR